MRLEGKDALPTPTTRPEAESTGLEATCRLRGAVSAPSAGCSTARSGPAVAITQARRRVPPATRALSGRSSASGATPAGRAAGLALSPGTSDRERGARRDCSGRSADGTRTRLPIGGPRQRRCVAPRVRCRHGRSEQVASACPPSSSCRPDSAAERGGGREGDAHHRRIRWRPDLGVVESTATAIVVAACGAHYRYSMPRARHTESANSPSPVPPFPFLSNGRQPPWVVPPHTGPHPRRSARREPGGSTPSRRLRRPIQAEGADGNARPVTGPRNGHDDR